MQHVFMLFLMGSLILSDALAGMHHLQAQSPWPLWVEVNVPVPPTPIKANGQVHLLYELHITNFDIATLELSRIEVVGGECGRAAASDLSGGRVGEHDQASRSRRDR